MSVSIQSNRIKDAKVFQSGEAIDSVTVTVAIEQERGSVDELRLFVTHPLPPMNNALFENRNQQLRDLAEQI